MHSSVTRRAVADVLKKRPDDVVVSSQPFLFVVLSFLFLTLVVRGQIVTALRTPIGKFRGGLKDMHAEVSSLSLLPIFGNSISVRRLTLFDRQELLSHVLKSTRERLEGMGVDVQGGAVQDIHNGTVLMELGGAKSGRLASLDAG